MSEKLQTVRRHYHITILGKVQGVWFRKKTREKARELNIDGLVNNKSDGSVFISAQGDESDLNAFIIFCNTGPKKAEVSNLHIEEVALNETSGFIIE